MALNYAWQRFYSAVHSLVSDGTLNERLAGAALRLNDLKPDDFHECELQKRFSDLMENLEGFQSEEVPNISADKGVQFAEEILSIFNEIAREYPNYHPDLKSEIPQKSPPTKKQASPTDMMREMLRAPLPEAMRAKIKRDLSPSEFKPFKRKGITCEEAIRMIGEIQRKKRTAKPKKINKGSRARRA